MDRSPEGLLCLNYRTSLEYRGDGSWRCRTASVAGEAGLYRGDVACFSLRYGEARLRELHSDQAGRRSDRVTDAEAKCVQGDECFTRKGVIHSGPKVGQVKTYRLDPSFGFKGRAKNMGKLLELVHSKDARKNPVKAPPASEEKRLEVEGQLKMFDAPEGK